MTTYNNLYLDVRRRLMRAGCPGASLEARELVCCGSGKTREEFYRDAPLYVSTETEASVSALVERHLRGEPVAYLIGQWDFYGLTLDISDAVLIPRTDTEVLAEEAVKYLEGMGKCRVLDLCAGSGCVGLAAAANAPESRVLLGELDPAAAQLCRQNIRRCGLTERVSVMVMDALQQPPKAIGAFQCILCNPPYIPRRDIASLDSSVRDYEPHLALCGGEDGLDFYRAITRNWRTALVPGGRLYFEVGIGQADAVRELMDAAGFVDVSVVPDTQGIDRVVCGAVQKEDL